MMQAYKRAFTVAQPRVACASMRAFSNQWKDKEIGEEKAYFSKQDAALLKNLVKKMEAREAMPSAASQEHDTHCDDLKAIFARHGLNKDERDSLLWQELLEWRRTKY